MRLMLAAAGLAAAAAAGCGTKAAPPADPAVPVAPATPAGPLTDNVNYANWKKFPVGTKVVRRIVAANDKGGVSTTSVETLTLKELTDKEVVLERQNTTTRSDGSLNAVNPPEPQRFARQFALPNGMTAEDFSKPSRNAKLKGEETVSVLGKDDKATVYTWTDGTEAGPLHITCWVSDDMPGRIVKQTMTQPNLGNTTTDEVVELKRP